VKSLETANRMEAADTGPDWSTSLMVETEPRFRSQRLAGRAARPGPDPSGTAGALLEFLGYGPRLALFLDKPEVWVLLDYFFHLVYDMPRRDRKAIRF
jgi:hypothetical protein